VENSKLGDKFVQDLAFNRAQPIVFEPPVVRDFMNNDSHGAGQRVHSTGRWAGRLDHRDGNDQTGNCNAFRNTRGSDGIHVKVSEKLFK
jgi:hypothetical protein